MLCTVAIVTALFGQVMPPKAKVMMLPSTFGIQPGTPFQLAVRMGIPRGWHTFFANPGMGGSPIKIRWELPAGFKAGPILWPIPKYVPGKRSGYIYDTDIWLSTDITPPASFPVGEKKFSFTANVTWQLSRERSVTQSDTCWVTLEVTRFERRNLLFSEVKRSQPIPAPGVPLHASMVGRQMILTLPLVQATTDQIRFFPGDPHYFDAVLPVNTLKGTGMEIAFPMSQSATKPPTRLQGLLVVVSPLGNKKRSHWIDIPVEKR